MHLRWWLLAPLAMLIASAVLLRSPLASEASVGVGVQAGSRPPREHRAPGGSYALPPVYVVNTGTQGESVRVRVERLSRGPGRLVPSFWIHVAGPGVWLAPHHAARIPLELVVPDGARSGGYLSDIVVTGSAAISAGTANLGVAAATKLEFSVRPGPAQSPWLSLPAWAVWALAGLILLALAVWGIRRSGLRIRVERKTARRGTVDHQGDTMWRSGRSAMLAIIGLSGCGNIAASNPAAGQSASIAGVAQDGANDTLGDRVAGQGKVWRLHSRAARNEHRLNAQTALGYPNGKCWVGMMDVTAIQRSSNRYQRNPAAESPALHNDDEFSRFTEAEQGRPPLAQRAIRVAPGFLKEAGMTDQQHRKPSPPAGPPPRPHGGAWPRNAPLSPPALGGSDNPRRIRRPIPVQAAAALSAAAITGAVSACSGNASTPPAQPNSATARATTTTPATTSGPALTGFGATAAQWKAAHTPDKSVPVRDAYLPHIGGDGQDTWQIVMTTGGRIISYTLNVTPSSLRSAEARARQEMPADTRVLWTRTVPGTCAQEQFDSATLAAALGDGQVNVEFDNATSGNATPITEELFSTYDAPTPAQAPAC
jgi:hypothetical protein